MSARDAADPQSAPETTTLSLDRLDGQAILNALDRMPYAAGLNFAPARSKAAAGTLVADDVVEALGKLEAALRTHARTCERDERELRELRAQRRAVRAFLGTDLELDS